MRSHKSFFVSFLALSLVGIFVTDAISPNLPKQLLNGKSVKAGELKYQVLIRQKGKWICGGALISNRHVLTAAHCFIGMVDPPYTEGVEVTTGMTKRSVGGEQHLLKSVTIHPAYAAGNKKKLWRNDIAVVTLATAANTNKLQAPIPLPSTDISERVKGRLSGWGKTAMDGEYPDKLKKSEVTIITLKECRERFAALDTNICGFDGKGKGFCDGDSGGPLVYNKEVVGIVSTSVYCGAGYPDLYTRVYSYKDFIQGVMQRT